MGLEKYSSIATFIKKCKRNKSIITAILTFGFNLIHKPVDIALCQQC